MASRVEAYPIGSKVRVKKPKKKPSNWNYEMTALAGKTFIIRAGPRHLCYNNDYAYTLEGYQWSWRHMDLELLELPKPEPNLAFRMKKHGF